MATAQKDVPVLRFKEFSDAWRFKPLRCFASKVKKKNTDQMESYALTNSATCGIVGQEDYFDRKIANNENLAGYYVVNVDDFIYNPRISASAPVGPIKRNGLVKGIMSPLYTVFRFINGNLDFFEHFFNSTKWHRYMKSIANYGARFDRMNISSTDFFNLPILFVSDEEQQKIAAFLSSVDTKIEQLNKKKALLEQYKKGMMQKLLTSEIRLPGFEGKWRVLNLGKSSQLKARIGWQGLTTTEYLAEGEYGLITGTDFLDESISWDTCYFVAKERYEQDKYIQIRTGDVLLTKDGTIGKVAYVDKIPFPATLNSGVFVIRPLENVYNRKFLYYILASQVFTDFLNKLRTGSTISHLYQKDFVKFDFFIPPTEKEQAEIAAFLSAIDKKIELVAKQLKQAQIFKKGLLQQMFI